MPGRERTSIERLRDTLDRSLFRPAPSDAARFTGWEGALVLVSFLALAVVLQLFRIGPSTALNSLWAEDGAVFLNGAMTHDFLGAVTMTHAEYLVVLPRLIAEIGTAVPLHDAPLAMNLATVLVIALSGLAVWFAAAGQVPSPYLRALLVALTVLCPVSSIEAVASPTNVAWYTSFAVFWLLFWRPATTWGACLGGLLILATGLSSPATLFFLPIVALRAIAVRNRRDVLVVGAFALGMAIQVPATLLSDEQLPGSVWTRHIITAFLQRVVDSSALGLELGGSTWADLGWPLLIAIVAAIAAYLSFLLARTSSSRLFAAIAIATSVAMFMASAYVRAPLGDFMVWRAGEYTNLGGRYAIVPTMLLISAILALVDDSRLRAWRGRPVAAIATAAVLLIALVTSFDARGDINRGGPPWDESLRTARAQCETKDLAEASVATAPEGWEMKVTCSRLAAE